MALTYEDFQGEEASEKVGLVVLHNTQLLRGWTVDSGSVHELPFSRVIEEVADSGVVLTEVADKSSIVAGTFFHDRSIDTLFLQTSDSANPNSKFVVAESKLFFSNIGVNESNDLSTGFAVPWIPLLEGTSQFGVELDNQKIEQLGLALEGSGSVTFVNDQEFWSPIFDKLTFENQQCFIYSWNRGLPITEAKIIYRGRVQSKSWSTRQVKFGLKDFLNEIRLPVSLDNIIDRSGVLVPDSLGLAKQRRIYGYLFGHRPTNIDQLVDSRYTITGTVAVTSGSATVTGTSSLFLKELSPDDSIFVGNDTTSFTVESIASDLSLTLTEVYNLSTKSGQTFDVVPSHPKRYINRIFLIAGHALRTPSTTVTIATALNLLTVGDTTDFLAGDEVSVGSEESTILRVSGDRLFLVRSLVALPAVSTVVVRNAVSGVFLNDDAFIKDRDYTFDASDATITLDELAEFNVTRIVSILGTVTFTTSSRAVTGTSTDFKTELTPGNWIRAKGEADFFEILSIESEIALTLRAVSTYTSTADGQAKKPAVYVEGSSVLSCDVIGRTKDDLTSGAFVRTGAEIVQDLITSAGITTADIDTASFTTASDLASERIGIAIPSTFNNRRTPIVRNVVDRVNKSIFGSLVQDNDFKLKYNILSPNKVVTDEEFKERDVLSFSIKADSDRIVKTARISYLFKEHDAMSGTANFQEEFTTSDEGQFLANTTKEFELDTLLVDLIQAKILANRFSFLLAFASSVIKFRSKLKPARLEVNDTIVFTHPKIYERVGSTDNRKVAAIQSLRKSVDSTEVSIEDLANIFTRTAAITAGTNPDFDSSSEKQRALGGYITDAFGMINNESETSGINLIW